MSSGQEYIVHAGGANLKSQFVTSSWGVRRIAPYAFTEQGLAMLSSVLNSKTAIQVNIFIVRLFVSMRQWAANYEELNRRIGELSASQSEHSAHIRQIYQIIEELVKPVLTERNPIGFKRD